MSFSTHIIRAVKYEPASNSWLPFVHDMKWTESLWVLNLSFLSFGMGLISAFGSKSRAA